MLYQRRDVNVYPDLHIFYRASLLYNEWNIYKQDAWQRSRPFLQSCQFDDLQLQIEVFFSDLKKNVWKPLKLLIIFMISYHYLFSIIKV